MSKSNSMFPDTGKSENNSWFLFDPSKGSSNSAENTNNSTNPLQTNFRYESPTAERLSSEDSYNQALRFNTFNNRDQQSNLDAGLSIGNRASTEAKRNSTSIDQQNKLFESSIAGAGGSRFGGSVTESFGLGAAAPTGYSTDFTGNRSLYNRSDVSNWRNRQNDVLNDTVRQESRLRDVDTNAQLRLSRNENSQNIENSNRQASIAGQNSSNDFLRNQRLEQGRQQTQRDVATIQAQGSILGSLFGTANAGTANYRYWG